MIDIRNITKEFDGNYVLTGVSETIRKGEIFAIIGPSGQGKTTLLRILGLLERPTSGQVLLEGRSIIHLSDNDPVRRRIGMVFQNHIAFKDSVYNNIAIGLRYRRFGKDEIKKKLLQKLDEIGLTGYENRKATTLSGGEKQRVSLARVMVTGPDILILDEPTANLDPVSTEVIENLIRYYNKELGTTVIMSTHDLVQGQRLADRVAVMMNGRFIQSGTIFDVFTRPCSVDVAKFIGIGNILPGKIIRKENGLSVILTHDIEIHAISDIPEGTMVRLAIRPEEITLYTGPAQLSSARNVISGTVTDIRPFGIISLIGVKSGDLNLSAQVTWQSINELDLKPGIQVVLSFKAPSVHIMQEGNHHGCL
ncbi:ABC transporter ATP-binding protein [Methanospirillum sp.]|uniref:ABC transporter ATP-binding protein n=1 Tax=Methanospirillum sp. TaxID=45200 RepID=UPI0035A14606